MSEFFEWISEFASTIMSVIQHIFTPLIQMYNLISTAITTYANALLAIPLWLRFYGGITLMVCAIYLLAGRSSGK